MKTSDATALFEQYLKNIENIKTSKIGKIKHFELSSTWFENSSDLIVYLLDWYFQESERTGTSGTANNHLVLDPFMGLGNTGIACLKLNVAFIGFEIDTYYYKTALKNLTASNK